MIGPFVAQDLPDSSLEASAGVADDSSPGAGAASAANDESSLAAADRSPPATQRARERNRNRRHHERPAITYSAVRTTRREVRHLAMLADADLAAVGPVDAPSTRGDCIDAPRPCPFVSCRHHLYLDVNRKGGVKLNFPDLEPWEMVESCSLDVADRGGETLETVGALMNVTRERIRQLEEKAMGKSLKALTAAGVHEEDVC